MNELPKVADIPTIPHHHRLRLPDTAREAAEAIEKELAAPTEPEQVEIILWVREREIRTRVTNEMLHRIMAVLMNE